MALYVHFTGACWRCAWYGLVAAGYVARNSIRRQHYYHLGCNEIAWYTRICQSFLLIEFYSSNNNFCLIAEIVTVLKGHTGLVKGVTWDPIGKYLSSQSEDKSLRIWRTVDWQTEIVITEPYEKVIERFSPFGNFNKNLVFYVLFCCFSVGPP